MVTQSFDWSDSIGQTLQGDFKMASRDLHTLIKTFIVVPAQAITSNTTIVGAIFPTALFEAVEFIFSIGKDVADGLYSMTLTHGDESNLSDGVPVPAEFLIGDLPANIFLDSEIENVGYNGHKTFLRADVVSTNVTAGASQVGINIILDGSRRLPIF